MKSLVLAICYLHVSLVYVTHRLLVGSPNLAAKFGSMGSPNLAAWRTVLCSGTRFCKCMHLQNLVPEHMHSDRTYA